MKTTWKCLLALCAAFGASAGAQQLAVYPSEVTLNNAHDVERLVAVLTRPDGVTVDVTPEVAVQFSAENVAAWGEDLKLYAAGDGEASLTVTHGDLSVQLPVKVENSGLTPPKTFSNDVLPALMRAGCNTGGCHGSAQGKNGFRLSLFGFDPQFDYISLTRDQRSRRINAALPEESLMLLKPLGKVDHEGGTALEEGGGVHETLLQWIKEGTQPDPEDLPGLSGIQIYPREAVLEGQGANQRFVVMANYDNGTTRDVTDVAVLSSSDELTLNIDGAGLSTAGNKGEVYVMARFGTFAVVSKAIVIDQGANVAWPEDAVARNYIDGHVFDKLKKLRVPPAELCSDQVFVRRAYVDILGTIPTSEETEAFLNDADPEKRAKLVDTLLERPEFSDLWAMKWAEVLRVAEIPNVLDRKGMHRYNDWLRAVISANEPLDQVVRELLSAEGGNFTNPASNFYLIERDPAIMAENVAQVFMGIQISCAQCHNHPFERWTMDDYYSFAAFFAQVGRKTSSDPRETIIFNSGGGEVKHLNTNQNMAPKFLGGDTPDVKGKDRRAVLADWMTSPENPWFSRNIANRVWAHYFGAGIVDPPDDVRVTNPPTNPQLHDELGAKLVEYDYDLRKLVRDICNSYTYQMSTRPRDPDNHDARNFSHAQVRRLTSEQMLDAIVKVTGNDVKFRNLPKGSRAVQVAGGNSGVYFLEVFGRPSRETVCTCERRNEPNLAQSLHLINGDTIDSAIKGKGGLLDSLLAAETPPAEIIDRLYLAAVSRKPSEEEKNQLNAYVDAAENKREALEDVFWTMLNAKEFIFNH
ncbi:MAG: DUF1553 domain-containing protein [Candidatus Hydrogenedentes bacterium]|nr:DUF1553 domain-containing protein [Candidatus Hydrogenedentota bacterium]